MSVQIRKTFPDPFCIRFLDLFQRDVSMHLEALQGSYEKCQLGAETAFAAFYVEEFLGSEIRSESCLGDDIVSESHGFLGGDDGVAAVGYVRERSAAFTVNGLSSNV